MASVTTQFRPSSTPDRQGTIYYRVIHNRKVRQIPTPYKVYPAEWDENLSNVSLSLGKCCDITKQRIYENIRRDIWQLNRIIVTLDHKGTPYTADDVVRHFISNPGGPTLFKFMDTIIVKLKSNGKMRTAEIYTSTLNSFSKFRGGDDIRLDCIESEVMEGYAAWLLRRGVTLNTLSFYARVLRAVYNRAIEQQIVDDRKPFRRIYTGVEKTLKRALPLAKLRQLKRLDLSDEPRLDFARDIFLFSFMLRGMSFVDMAYLRKKDLDKDNLSYRRRKTGQKLFIKWTSEMQAILDKYPKNSTPYLLPIITDSKRESHSFYRTAARRINQALKAIAGRMGITIPLTLYVARHSWASVAREQGIPVSVISEGMGHESEATTRIYLASLDTSVVDHANALVLKSLL